MSDPTRPPFVPRPPRPRRRWLIIGSLLAISLAAAVATGSNQASAAHGVDTVGRYVMQDSVDPGGPTFHPLTVSTDLHLEDDTSATVALPFAFEYYGQEYSDVTVGANGAVSLPGGHLISRFNQSLATVNSNLIAPWWDDWNPGAHGQVLTGIVGSAPNRVFVAWWKDVAHADQPDGGYASFQVQLFEGSNRIEFHYPEAGQTDISPYGLTGTVGIDNGAVSLLHYSVNQGRLRSNRAIRFVPATCGGRPATWVGTYGPDLFNLNNGDDVILALGGDDHITTGSGEDLVCAGSGNDVVDTGSEADRVIGGPGTDSLLGQGANDILEGGPGADLLGGGGGQDTCRGGPGNDSSSFCEVRVGFP